jgi:hypothetical protein
MADTVSASAATRPVWLEGAVDLHVHCAPSLFPRWGDGVDVAAACEAAGMRGVLLKAHHGSTQEMADVLTRTSNTLKIAGGVVLNRYVGGINPAAVEASLRTGAQCVWFPTIDAEGHVRAFGGTGAYPAQQGGQESKAGISVLDAEGRCLPKVREVLKLAAEHGTLVATGHLGATEIDALLREAYEIGVTKFLINHVSFATPSLDEDAVGTFVERGAMVELTYLDISPMWKMSTLENTVRLFRRAGASNVVLSSDAGQPHNPSPPEALRVFAQSLYERGLPAQDVRRALTDNPRGLLGW